MKRIVEIPAMVRAASVTPATINTDERTVELVWSTGAAVRRFDWVSERPFLEELSMELGHIRMDRLNSGAPLLNTHDEWDVGSVLGVVEKAWLATSEGRAIVRFSKRAEVGPVWQDVQDGIIRNVSVGYRVYRFQDVTKPTDAMKRLLAVDWEPMEISLVPIGADNGGKVRQDKQRSPCEIEDTQDSGGQPAEAPPTAQHASIVLALKRLDLAQREI
jgi:hypothetical protein